VYEFAGIKLKRSALLNEVTIQTRQEINITGIRSWFARNDETLLVTTFSLLESPVAVIAA
jgi:hypothetical protein